LKVGTRRLYWERPYDTEFEAKVTNVSRKDDEFRIELDSTLFYPEGGGQPCDLGTIFVSSHEFAVVRVFEEAGKIVHVLRLKENPATGTTYKDRPSLQREPVKKGLNVKGKIDWHRRFDHMQQHTGQHILSRAFEKLVGANTVGFHLSREYASVDLDVSSLSQEEIFRVEELANEIVFRDLPVDVVEYTPEKIPEAVRKRIAVEAPKIRVVLIGDFDACACGGTHVSSTGQVGIVRVSKIDRAHGGVRVVFKCGWRVFYDFREKEKILNQTAKILSQSPRFLPNVVGSLAKKVSELEKERETLRKALLELEIKHFIHEVSGSDSQSSRSMVVKPFPGKNPRELRIIAAKTREATGKTVVVFSQKPKFSVAVATCPSGDAAEDAALFISKIAERWGGRGGGNRNLAQLGSKEPVNVPEEDIIQGVAEIYQVLHRV